MVLTVATLTGLVLPHSDAWIAIAWFVFCVESMPVSVAGLPKSTEGALATRVTVTGAAAVAAAARAAPAIRAVARIFSIAPR